jgi:transcriptional regulator with GAF, ATPase, and Fis domain
VCHHDAVKRRPSIPDSATPALFPALETTVLKQDASIHAMRNLVGISVPKLTLSVRRESEFGERRMLHVGEVCRIGSHASNDLVLRDPAVSRFHCRLTREGNAWRLVDSGSSNGTRLDGVRIRDAQLGPEGTLTLGDSIIHVQTMVAADEQAVRMIPSFGALSGTGLAMKKLFVLLEKVAASQINVLIEGESGTGKELVATEIVQRGPRADKPFVIVDCGAISPSLVESELFGHVRGAFTGAERDRVGAFETANGGTVFLDEVGELPLALQPKLLRALESREIRRVGETRTRKVDVRVVAATNRNLERELNQGRFREDLYFRLAVMNVRVPSLRERLEDLPVLIRGFLAMLGVPEQESLFPASVIAELGTHDWPGNVRELRNYVARSVVLKESAPTSRRRNQDSEAPPSSVDITVPFTRAKDAVVDAFEVAYLTALLGAAGGNISKAARTGGMDRMYLHRLVQKHGLGTR